jgi:hypothetical protein
MLGVGGGGGGMSHIEFPMIRRLAALGMSFYQERSVKSH